MATTLKPLRTIPHRRRWRFTGQTGIVVLLTFLGILTFIPLLMLIQLSFKDMQQMADSMWLPVTPLYAKNYVKAFGVMRPYFVNSIVFVLGTVSISMFCSVLSAYAFGRYDFPGREIFYFGILALLMIPGVLTLISTFTVVVRLNLNNTLFGIWLPMAAGAQAFQIVVLRTFFASLPGELFEAGRIDGASEKIMLWKIALPLAKPIMTTLMVLQMLSVWNEYIWPIMVLSDPSRYPVILGILRLSQLITARDPGATFAGYVLAGFPLLVMFAFTSRAFIRGLTSGAVKF